VDAVAPADGMLWGDGFEIETVLNCRIAAARLKITEVPPVEGQRMFGDTNLRTFVDGSRVLRTLIAEHRRMSTRYRRANPQHRNLGSDRQGRVVRAGNARRQHDRTPGPLI
jgi:hypothetical protein